MENGPMIHPDRLKGMKPEVYILLCSNLRFYIGSTNNIERRIREHNIGKTKATKYIRPVLLVFRQEFESLTKARRVERKLKTFKNTEIIKKIINDGIIKSV